MTLKFLIPEEFSKYIEPSVVRLSYLFPDLDFTFSDKNISIEISNPMQNKVDLEKQIKKEIFNQLYREKIFYETLPIKKWLFSGAKGLSED